MLAGLKPLVPRLKKIWADGAYSGKDLANWCQERGGWKLEVVERDREAEGFEVLSKRWIVERIRLARQKPSIEQGLRAQAPDQRGPDRGGYDSPNVEATGEFSVDQQRIDYSV